MSKGPLKAEIRDIKISSHKELKSTIKNNYMGKYKRPIINILLILTISSPIKDSCIKY